MAAAPRRQLKGCHLESLVLSTLSPQDSSTAPKRARRRGPSPHSPSQPGCLPATLCTSREEPCPKAPGALPEQHLRGHGRLLPTGCTGAQGQRDAVVIRFLNRRIIQLQEGQRLELDCWRNKTSWKVTWIRLDKDGNLHFILSSTHSYSNTMQEGEKTAPNFEVLSRGNFYRLVVKSFRAQDEGIYFCINYINPGLHISSGQPAFFPVTTTAAPTTATAANQSSQVTMRDISQHSPDTGTSNENTPRFYCKMVMWVNLAVTCLLLLTAITITITHCQSST